MRQFKVGDRVAVYDNGKRQVGAVGLITESGVRVDAVRSQACATWTFGWFHPKQLRRLVKHKRRRVWLANSAPADFALHGLHMHNKPVLLINQTPPDPENWVEFVEVRRKKP